MTAASDPFLTSTVPLTPQDAVAAIVSLPGKRYLMQLRDAKPGIFYPGFWGCFGGAIDPGETPEQALLRELEEELGLPAPTFRPQYFVSLGCDFAFMGGREVRRSYWELTLSDEDAARVRIGEGAAVQALGRNEVLTLRVTPYDAFALWLHVNRALLREGEPGHAFPVGMP